MSSSLNQWSLISNNEMNDGSLCNSMQKKEWFDLQRGSGIIRKNNGHTKRNILAERNVSASGTVLSATADTKDCAKTDPRNGENSSQVFGLGHRLFNRKVSFDEKSGPYGSLKFFILDQSEQNDIVRQPHPETNFKKKVSFRDPIDLLPTFIHSLQKTTSQHNSSPSR
ncbi:hypothetical protein KIW84_010623 [Lathyrus oleraceus]|uniref:Uncharacterized protein n=1 Tax=Pisum sativum TaxID=3888 RepID=A0A9D5BE70_PEA|nr:hypothetical protein KIW84_010623 [Pisum sativum]